MDRISRIAERVAERTAALWQVEPEKDMEVLKRLVPGVLSGIRRKFPRAKLGIRDYVHASDRSANVEISGGGSGGRSMLVMESVHSRGTTGDGRPANFDRWEIRGTDPDNPGIHYEHEYLDWEHVPTVRDVMEVFEKMVKRLGEKRVATMLGIDIWERPGEAKPTLAEVEGFVKVRFRIEPEERGSDSLHYATRDNGSVGDESPGAEDIRLMRDVKRQLLDKYGSNNLEVELETVDEWVDLAVRLK